MALSFLEPCNAAAVHMEAQLGAVRRSEEREKKTKYVASINGKGTLSRPNCNSRQIPGKGLQTSQLQPGQLLTRDVAPGFSDATFTFANCLSEHWSEHFDLFFPLKSEHVTIVLAWRLGGLAAWGLSNFDSFCVSVRCRIS